MHGFIEGQEKEFGEMLKSFSLDTNVSSFVCNRKDEYSNQVFQLAMYYTDVYIAQESLTISNMAVEVLSALDAKEY